MLSLDSDYKQFLKLCYIFNTTDQFKRHFYIKQINSPTTNKASVLYFIFSNKLKFFYDPVYQKNKLMMRINEGNVLFGREIKKYAIFSMFYRQLKKQYE